MSKKINIVKKGLQWGKQIHSPINLHEIAHPVDKALLSGLEAIHVEYLLNEPVEQMVAAQYGSTLAIGIVVDDNNFPELFKLLKGICRRVGIKIPYTVISNEISGINAFATGTDEKPYIVLSNYAPSLMKSPELKFILAHECGHIAMQHMVYHTAVVLSAAAGGLIPLIGPAVAKLAVFPLNFWNRCSEITADHIGLLCCEDLQSSQRALLRIVGGMTNVNNIDIDHYIAQSKKIMDSHLLSKIGEYFQSHPMIYKRLKALEYFSESELYYRASGKTAPQNIKLYTTAQLNEKISNLLSVL